MNSQSSIQSDFSGLKLLQNSLYNKGLALSADERKIFGVVGLLPNQFLNIHEQMEMVIDILEESPTELSKYVLLMNLFYKNQRLFFYVVTHNLPLTMPIIYTPIVGLACQNFGKLSILMPEGVQGLYISIKDQDNILDIFDRWPHKNIDVICVTDGERILGLGDLGSYGMGIPVGKLMLYTACAGVPQTSCLPIHVDVGTNTQKLIEDKFYTGLKQPRVTGDEYVKFIDKFMDAVIKKYGVHTLIQFEDFGNHNAFHLINRYRDKYCTFNDDIQGTAAVTVSGLISACQITGIPLSQNTFLFQGAGEAALGIAHLLTLALQTQGLSLAEARKRIWLFDSKGLIFKDRPAGSITDLKKLYAHEHEPVDTLLDAVASIKPTAIIGVAAVPRAFTHELIRRMSFDQKRPIIFALSNPTSKAECTAEEAYNLSEGRCVFASGSPFDDVTKKKKVPTATLR